MKRILFVDDEPLVLRSLQLTLSRMRGEWEMKFVNSGSEAVKLMAEQPVDVIISDMRMPGTNGMELLNQVMQTHPMTARIILSGYADSAMTMSCAGATHQFLLKPCDGRTLLSSIQRALRTTEWLDNDRAHVVAARLTRLPGLPPVYFRILEELQTPDATLARVGQIISNEPRIAQQLLLMVNSGAFGFARPTSNPAEAVLQLGIELIKPLVLAAHLFIEFTAGEGSKSLVERICRHSLGTAVLARRIARLEGKEDRFAQESFTAGLLHDLGRLALVTNLPHEYAEALTCSQMKGIPLFDSEQTNLGLNHAEVGGYVLSLWGMPASVVEAAMFHHTPRLCPNREFTPLTAAHIADTLDKKPVAGVPAELLARLDQEYLADTGVWPRMAQILKALEHGPAA